MCMMCNTLVELNRHIVIKCKQDSPVVLAVYVLFENISYDHDDII